MCSKTWIMFSSKILIKSNKSKNVSWWCIHSYISTLSIYRVEINKSQEYVTDTVSRQAQGTVYTWVHFLLASCDLHLLYSHRRGVRTATLANTKLRLRQQTAILQHIKRFSNLCQFTEVTTHNHKKPQLWSVVWTCRSLNGRQKCKPKRLLLYLIHRSMSYCLTAKLNE